MEPLQAILPATLLPETMPPRRRALLWAALAVSAAGVVLVLLLVRKRDEEALRDLVLEAARRHALDARLVDAVVRAESRYQAGAISRKGAFGLMQLTVPTACEVARRAVSSDELLDPGTNLELGCIYLKSLLKSYDGEVRLALMAYNAGPGSVARWRRQERDPEAILANLAYPETRGYVARVLAYMSR